uniref:hypothetical protein n=1 Tax=Sulfuriferula sp. GW6 TaxID=3345112 RepID=UPI0039F738BB
MENIETCKPTGRRNGHGDQVLINTENGEECVSIDGRLYAPELADAVHRELLRRAAADLMAAAELALEAAADPYDWNTKARPALLAAIRKAKGGRE